MKHNKTPLSEIQYNGIRVRINTMVVLTAIMGSVFLFINFKSWPTSVFDLITLSVSVIAGAFIAFKQPQVLNTGRVYDDTDLEEEEDDEAVNLYINSFDRSIMIYPLIINLFIIGLLAAFMSVFGFWWRINDAIAMTLFNSILGIILQYFLCWLIHYYYAFSNALSR
jgi:hypothetical protein